MAFTSTTNIPTLDALLTDMVAFAVSHAGFTNSGTVVLDGNLSPARPSYHIAKGSMNYHFTTTTDDEIMCTMSLDYSGGGWGNWTHEPSHPSASESKQWCRTTFYEVTSNYAKRWFFTDGDGVSIVVEVTNGAFIHFGFGKLNKAGTWTGGEYIYGSRYTSGSPWSSITHWYSEVSQHWFPFGQNLNGGTTLSTQSCMYVDRGKGDWRDFLMFGGSQADRDDLRLHGSTLDGPIEELYAAGVNESTKRAPLFPQYIFMFNDTTDQHTFLGTVPNMRIMDMSQLNPSELTNTDFQVFPLTQKNGDSQAAPNSENRGLAYQRIP